MPGFELLRERGTAGAELMEAGREGRGGREGPAEGGDLREALLTRAVGGADAMTGSCTSTGREGDGRAGVAEEICIEGKMSRVRREKKERNAPEPSSPLPLLPFPLHRSLSLPPPP